MTIANLGFLTTASLIKVCTNNSTLSNTQKLAENCVFFILLSYSAPPLPMLPLEFRGEINHEETGVMGLLCGEGCMILTLTDPPV